MLAHRDLGDRLDHKVLEIPADVDLAEFARFLWGQKVAHRIRFYNGVQELWLAEPSDADFVSEQFERWQQGSGFSQRAETSRIEKEPSLITQLLFVPITFALLIVSLVLTLLTGFGDNTQWLHWFTFVDFKVQNSYLLFQSLDTLFKEGEYWRFVTPIFLHYSALHLIFNMLWTYELGRRIERVHQRSVVIALVLVMGISSNIAQFIMTGPLFGGLSGVIYGMMAYTWLWDRMSKDYRFGLPPVLMTFMVIWLLLGVTGLFEQLGMGSMANTAHLVGLLSGLACAPVVYHFRRRVWRLPS